MPSRGMERETLYLQGAWPSRRHSVGIEDIEEQSSAVDLCHAPEAGHKKAGAVVKVVGSRLAAQME